MKTKEYRNPLDGHSSPLCLKLTEPVGVTMTWSSSVASIGLRASRTRRVISISARDGSAEPLG